MHMNMPICLLVWRMRVWRASQRACDQCNACNNAKEKHIYVQGQAPVNVNKTKSLHRLTEPHTDNSHYMLYTYIYSCTLSPCNSCHSHVSVIFSTIHAVLI